MYGTSWTDEELRYVVEARGRGESFRKIAAHLGRTHLSVKAKINACAKESDQHEAG